MIILNNYLKIYNKLINTDYSRKCVKELAEKIKFTKKNNGKLILAGNGASASIASHLATDFSKQAGVRSIAFNEPNLITALGYDFGYENWISKAVELYADPVDLLILISSSGTSANMVKAAGCARKRCIAIASLTGFSADNPLGKLADLNLWANSRAYNIVECTHMIWLTATCDFLIGRHEYSVKKCNEMPCKK